MNDNQFNHYLIIELIIDLTLNNLYINWFELQKWQLKQTLKKSKSICNSLKFHWVLEIELNYHSMEWSFSGLDGNGDEIWEITEKHD